MEEGPEQVNLLKSLMILSFRYFDPILKKMIINIHLCRGDLSIISAEIFSLPGTGELQMNHLADFITLTFIFNTRCLNFGGAGFDSYKKRQPVSVIQTNGFLKYLMMHLWRVIIIHCLDPLVLNFRGAGHTLSIACP